MKELQTIRGYHKLLTYCILENKKIIDVIMIHESGIYVIEHRKEIGNIFGKEYDSHWIQKEKGLFGLTKKNKITNPITENQEKVKLLKNVLPKEVPIYSYITYKEDCDLNKLDITAFKQPVRVIKRKDTTNLIRTRAINQKKILLQEEIDNIYELLKPLTEVPIML